MNVRRQNLETTRTAMAACRTGLSCAYFGHGPQPVEHKPLSSILVGTVDARRGG
jgi:hypothetical protein